MLDVSFVAVKRIAGIFRNTRTIAAFGLTCGQAFLTHQAGVDAHVNIHPGPQRDRQAPVDC